MKRKFIGAVLMMVMVMVMGAVAHGSSDGTGSAVSVRYYADGIMKQLSADGTIIVSDRAYLPLSDVSALLNADAGWHQARMAAFLGTTPDWSAVDKDPASLLDPLPIRYYYNGVKTALPESQAIFIRNGVPYAPVRFLAESMGLKVDWAVEKGIPTIRFVSQQGQ